MCIVLVEHVGSSAAPSAGRKRLAKVLCIEWIGQSIASLCWIASVLAYGIGSVGDWLQLFAASAWLLANFAAVAASGSE